MMTMGSESLDCSDCTGCTGPFNQLGNSVAQLRALALPKRYARQIQTQRFLFLISDRIVEAYAFDEATIATIARISYNHIVEWTIL
jgi:hypothetical protein